LPASVVLGQARLATSCLDIEYCLEEDREEEEVDEACNPEGLAVWLFIFDYQTPDEETD